MSEPTILVTVCCALCSEHRDVAIPFADADVFERALLECVPDRWTRNDDGLFECPRHRPGPAKFTSIAFRRPANNVRG
jgi:hypothetical protein